MGPKKKKTNNVGDFFKAFKDAGAVPVDPSEEGESSRSGVAAFSGGGFRLGSDETPSTMIGGGAGPSTGAAAKGAGPKKFVLKMKNVKYKFRIQVLQFFGYSSCFGLNKYLKMSFIPLLQG